MNRTVDKLRRRHRRKRSAIAKDLHLSGKYQQQIIEDRKKEMKRDRKFERWEIFDEVDPLEDSDDSNTKKIY